ncbi:MAG TPA: coagulation factor 5/8 type domain-containing protein, partial [Thermoanaerobaculia bacterium]|nr:coagulation factor 5/8 type domain-containing protein [Thermoanaerobaculia bacterium]
KGGYSIEPFLYAGGHLAGWNDVQSKPSLARGSLPIPSVEWPQLTITAYAQGKRGESTLYVDYLLHSTKVADVILFLAIRPFQVNPPWQFLGNPGGVSSINDIRFQNHVVQVDERQPIIPMTPASGFGAFTFDEGNIVDWLKRGVVPDRSDASDEHGAAAGALAFNVHLDPTHPRHVTIAIPLHEKSRASDGMRAAAIAAWSTRLNRAAIELPPSARQFTETIRASAAYILINRNGPALQPGTRSYERSWIRDGSMMSAALLRLGMADVVREYINWYVQFQYPDGKVPCCVDSRGADPVPENDSHGELIYLIAEYYRYTHDRDLINTVWPHVVSAVNYIDKLRHTQTAPEFFGLLPESISHEGYSAKPEHSFWDDFFAAKGLADAKYLAHEMGFVTEEKTFTKIYDEFERDLLLAVAHAMTAKGIDYIPGSVELGDFDPTSTTIAISPGAQLGRLPQRAVNATFDRYFAEAHARAIGMKDWEHYTPYELRTVGTFIRLGQPQRAHELLSFFFAGQRPAEWREWAEVVWRDPKTPKFIGDMPHGWVASDFLRSALDMFAYDRFDGAVVIGAGVLPQWVTQSPGVLVRNLATHQGVVSFSMKGSTKLVRVHVAGPIQDAIVHSPIPKVKSVSLNGRTLPPAEDVRVRRFPADVVFSY